jgi:hypothetical protein
MSPLPRAVSIAALALCVLASSVLMAAGEDSIPHLRRQGSTVQLIVDGKPFVMLAGELHNSSASSLPYMQGVWPKLKALNLNTVLATLSWELVEPEEGKFDFSLVDGLIQQARQNDMKLVFLWFGSWKNGVSSYVPAWVKKDTHRFPCAQGSSNRNTKDIITPLSEANMQADARAFAAVMRRIREIDSTRHTVLMVQVENEVGIKPELRDLSALGDETFAKQVPAELMQYLTAHKDTLVPEMKATWERTGFKTSGAWREVFGDGGPTDEIFSTWYYARYINAVAKAGKAEYAIPMYANAWLRGSGKLGTYPTGGPLAHVMDIWRAAGSDIDLYAPDIYLPDFKAICAEYTQSGNPLLIPEAQTDDAAVARAFWAIAQHNALCFAPFGIDHVPDNHPIGDGYAVLRQLMPLITAADDHHPVLVRVLAQVLLGGRELDLALLAQVVLDQVFQRIEDAGREDVQAEMGQVIAGRQARRRKLLAGDLDAGFFDDELGLVDALGRVDRVAPDRPEQVQVPLERRMHSCQSIEHVLLVDSDELAGAAVLDSGDVNMVAEHENERLFADKLLGLVNRLAKAVGRVLLGEVQALAEGGQLLRFPDRPVLAAKAAHHVVVQPAEIVAIELFLARLGDDADFLDPRLDGLLADDLDHWLGQPVAIHQREHFLLHGGGRGILPGALSGGGDDGFSDLGYKNKSCATVVRHSGYVLPRGRQGGELLVNGRPAQYNRAQFVQP